DVQELLALHREPALPANRRRAAVRSHRQSLSVDERDDRSEKGAQLLRDARDRVPNRRCAELGMIVACSLEGSNWSCNRVDSVQSAITVLRFMRKVCKKVLRCGAIQS